MNWAEFFDMGGYAFFVWTSYGLAFIVIVANIVSPIMQRKKVISRIKRAIKRENIEQANSEKAVNSGKAGS
ncbi:MAG: heme exporter protein CcmD [Gammaproteobacteria bacterium]|nr:MAG: heme exporter protein CcmD [Gammaproteobacteria bacterium]